MIAIALASIGRAETPETRAVELDQRLLADPRAAVERFALAERMGDDRSLALPDPLPATLPWSVRDRAHLVLGRAAVELGDDARGREHLLQVFPDSPAWAEARLLLGDVARREGDHRAAVLAYRDAIGPDADGEALLRIADVYAELGRWDTVRNTLEMVPRSDPDWSATLARSARALLALGEVESAAGTLAVSLAAEPWAPERELLRAAAEGRSSATARSELAGFATAIERLSLGTGAAAWDAWFGGAASEALPRGWSVQFLRRGEVSPLLARIGRIEQEIALGGSDPFPLIERRAATVEALGDALVRALADERARLASLAAGPAAVVGPPRRALASLGDSVVWWPFNGELWRDEVVAGGRLR